MKTSVVGLVVLGFMALASCVGDEEVTSSVVQESRCPAFGCSNSDELILHGTMHELNLKGVPNAEGAWLQTGASGRAQLYPVSGLSYDLYVTNGTITGRRSHSKNGLPSPLDEVISGTQLVGKMLRVMNGSTLQFRIHIDAVRTMFYPVPVGTHDPLEVYTLSYYEPNTIATTRPNVCEGYDPVVKHDSTDLLDMHDQETLLFEGDRIRRGPKTVEPTVEKDWVNFGCAGRTLAKMRLTRNTSVENATTAKRQATLKMLVADYCGGGRPFTVTGVPLRWQGDAMAFWTTPVKIEARWNENGATCLRMPRILQLDPPSEYFNPADVWPMIQAECAARGHAALLPCHDPEFDPYTQGPSVRITALP
jgi:ADYC domain